MTISSKKPIRNIFISALILILSVVMTGCGGQESSAFNPDYDTYNTYAFFGVDSRAAGTEDWKTDDSTGTEGAPSSDVIMLMRIDPDTGAIKVVSVYRDTMLDVAGDGSDLEKCNTAYRNGGPYGAIDMLEKNLDIRISGYVSANFLAVADAIDSLGGVEVDVEDQGVMEAYKGSGNDVVDIMNNLIDELNKVYDRDTPHIKKAGRQTLSGIQAVAYSRVRYTQGGDMQRSVRQRNVLALMMGKLQASDSQKQREVLKGIYPSIDTDLAENELMDMFGSLGGFSLDDMEGFPYYKVFYNTDKVKGNMFVPCDLVSNVTELHKRVYGEAEYAPNKTVQEYSKLIEEESGFGADDADESLNDSY